MPASFAVSLWYPDGQQASHPAHLLPPIPFLGFVHTFNLQSLPLSCSSRMVLPSLQNKNYVCTLQKPDILTLLSQKFLGS